MVSLSGLGVCLCKICELRLWYDVVIILDSRHDVLTAMYDLGIDGLVLKLINS